MTVILLLSVYHRMPDIPRGKLIVKESGLFSGREVIDILFKPAVEQLSVDWNVEEGSEIKAGDKFSISRGVEQKFSKCIGLWNG